MREDPHESLADRYRQALAPAPPAIDQHTLWYEAGRASVTPRRGWVLPAYSAAMTVTAASFAFVVLAGQSVSPPPSQELPQIAVTAPVEPSRQGRQPEVAVVREPETPGVWASWLAPKRVVDPNSYLARRERALGGDLDWRSRALTRVELRTGIGVVPSPPATRERLLEEYLPDRGLRVPERPAGDPRTESIVPPAKELA